MSKQRYNEKNNNIKRVKHLIIINYYLILQINTIQKE